MNTKGNRLSSASNPSETMGEARHMPISGRNLIDIRNPTLTH